MLLPLLLLLSLLGLSSTAPVPVDQNELAARKFFGSLLKHSKNNNSGKVFDLLYLKLEHHLPGLITLEQSKELRTAFIEYQNNGEKNKFTFKLPPTIPEHIERILRERVEMLDVEATVFINNLIHSMEESLLQGPPKVRQFCGDFSTMRAKFESLSESGKASLIQQFPIFGDLNELAATVRVFDRLVAHVIGFCQELPGFSDCEDILQLV